MNETKKPVIRFQGFSGEWKQRRVGELIEDYTEKTVVQNQYPVLTSSQQQGIVRQEEYFADRQVTTNDNVGYFVLPFGYFTYRSRSDTDVFVFNRNDIIYKGIISYYYPVFVPKSCDSNFLLRRLNYGIKKQLSMAAEGTGQKVLAHSKFKGMIVDVPDEKEQIKIGVIFEYIDNLIAQHQSKFEKLQAVKASMLEKMFPKDGADVPEVRFNGFSGAWERRKLSDIAERVVRKNYNNESSLPLTISAQYGLVDQTTYFNKRIASRDVSNYYLVLKGEFAYNKSTSDSFPFGAVKRLDLYEKGVLSTLYIVLRIKNQNETNSNYLAVFFDTDRWHKGVAERAAEGARNHGLLNISADDFLDIDLLLPRTEREQAAIGKYFCNLDHLISLQRQELDKLQSIKKALLEKMFV